MKKLFFFIIICSCFFSCSRNDIETNDLNVNLNDRLVFSDFDEFQKTYATLAKYQTEEDVRFWAQSKRHSTLLDSRDTAFASQSKYSTALRAILNQDSEIQIGDLIVWFNINTGELLGYPKQSIPDKTKPDGFTKIGMIKVEKVEFPSRKWTGVAGGSTNSPWQYQFTVTRYAECNKTVEDPISGMRKWVAELYHEYVYNSSSRTWYSHLYLRIKLEERTPSINWRQCFNYRELEYYVEGETLYMLGYSIIDTSSFSRSASYLNCGVSGPVNVLLDYDTVVSPLPAPAYNVAMTGWIRQHIVGDNTPQKTFPSDEPGGELF